MRSFKFGAMGGSSKIALGSSLRFRRRNNFALEVPLTDQAINHFSTTNTHQAFYRSTAQNENMIVALNQTSKWERTRPSQLHSHCWSVVVKGGCIDWAFPLFSADMHGIYKRLSSDDPVQGQNNNCFGLFRWQFCWNWWFRVSSNPLT